MHYTHEISNQTDAIKEKVSAGGNQQEKRIVVVIPAYNEERFIGSVILRLLQYPVKIIVVDDGSSDETAKIAAAGGALVFKHGQNLGKAKALNTGIKEACQMDPDVIVVIDGDGQHMPEDLEKLISPVINGEADIVVGSRYLENRSNVPRHRLFGHRFFNILTGMTSNIMLTDSQSGYRAFSPNIFINGLFESSGFTVESEMQFFAKEHGLRVVEVPVTILYADKPKRPVIQQGIAVLNGVLHLIGQYRPLLFFGLPGLILILVGFGMGFIVIDIYRRVSQLAVGYAMISVLLTVIGMLLFSTSIILHSVRGLLVEMLSKIPRHE